MKSGWKARLLVTGMLASLTGASSAEERLSLDGVWAFAIDRTKLERPAAEWDQLPVPGNWDTVAAYSTHKGEGWYRRDFVVPRAWRGRRLRLRFEAVYHDAIVTLNGRELGRHNGGYTPFEFDVTDNVTPGETSTVTVGADNTYRRGAWWHWGGISRSVQLIANDEARIVWQHIRAEPDLAAGTARVVVRTKLANAGGQPLAVSIGAQLEGRPESALGQTVTIPARGEVIVERETLLTRDRVRLWHFDHPNLYRLTTRVVAGKKVVHERTDRFGIRKIEVTKDSLLLNGERVRLCGFNRISDSREAGNSEPMELVRQDIDLMKRAGANLARLMHHPQAPGLLDYLDEKGMLIWGEIPVWGADDPQVAIPDNPRPRQWMAEMIERDGNHPCIIGWSVGNELMQHFDYVKGMIDYTRSLDPHRLIAYVSFTGARKEYDASNDPISVSDLTLYNTYGGGRAIVEALRRKWPDKPIFFAEIGTRQFGANLDATIPGLEQMVRALTAPPYVIGVSLWTFNDYRSDYRGTPASGNREWGVVDVQRRPKAAYEQVRRLFSPVHALELSGRTVRVVPRNPDDVPSFTLRGYQLRWSVRDAAGAIVRSGVVAVPDLKPGAAAWTTTLPDAPAGVLEVLLFSPTGYDVATAAIVGPRPDLTAAPRP